ncbi:hypothetical protein L3X38_034516 [Prunus dulcis]|uniref:Uncharacterized protein n=1 Tax=Prunus dulcis TaxID=3755 RepID=A0AAD4VKG3_PRUDU|nr:hypothetical protein L3X38_034516 [Prunus dulcis]
MTGLHLAPYVGIFANRSCIPSSNRAQTKTKRSYAEKSASQEEYPLGYSWEETPRGRKKEKLKSNHLKNLEKKMKRILKAVKDIKKSQQQPPRTE